MFYSDEGFWFHGRLEMEYICNFAALLFFSFWMLWRFPKLVAETLFNCAISISSFKMTYTIASAVADSHLQMQGYTLYLVGKYVHPYAPARAFKLPHMKLSMEATYPQLKLNKKSNQRYVPVIVIHVIWRLIWTAI